MSSVSSSMPIYLMTSHPPIFDSLSKSHSGTLILIYKQMTLNLKLQHCTVNVTGFIYSNIYIYNNPSIPPFIPLSSLYCSYISSLSETFFFFTLSTPCPLLPHPREDEDDDIAHQFCCPASECSSPSSR